MNRYLGRVLSCFACGTLVRLSDGIECSYCGERYYLDPVDPRIKDYADRYNWQEIEPEQEKQFDLSDLIIVLLFGIGFGLALAGIALIIGLMGG